MMYEWRTGPCFVLGQLYLYVFAVQGMSLIYLEVDLLLVQASAKVGGSSKPIE